MAVTTSMEVLQHLTYDAPRARATLNTSSPTIFHLAVLLSLPTSSRHRTRAPRNPRLRMPRYLSTSPQFLLHHPLHICTDPNPCSAPDARISTQARQQAQNADSRHRSENLARNVQSRRIDEERDQHRQEVRARDYGDIVALAVRDGLADRVGWRDEQEEQEEQAKRRVENRVEETWEQGRLVSRWLLLRTMVVGCHVVSL